MLDSALKCVNNQSSRLLHRVEQKNVMSRSIVLPKIKINIL